MAYVHSKSPLPLPVNHQRDCMSAAAKSYKYLRRMFKYDHMDFEFAFWQMLYLCYAPQKVYRNFQYRKQTKSQFARDDPAFLLLFAAALCITSVGFAIVLRLGILQFLVFLLYVIFVDCIAVGIIIATLFWYVLNRYFRLNNSQDVEWGFAFDVHLNAFFPPLILLHFCQLFFYNGLISHEWFVSRFVGNTFWLVAQFYYIYITFLGYNSLMILKGTKLILYFLPICFLLYVISLASGFNSTLYLMNFYNSRADKLY